MHAGSSRRGWRSRRCASGTACRQIARRHELQPNQGSTWKRQLLEGIPEVFAGGAGRKLAKEHEAKIRDLHAKIGVLTLERDFFSARAHSAEPGGACADDRAGRTAESFGAVCAAGRGPVVAVLSAEGGERAEPGVDAAHGRAAHGVSVLRQPFNLMTRCSDCDSLSPHNSESCVACGEDLPQADYEGVPFGPEVMQGVFNDEMEKEMEDLLERSKPWAFFREGCPDYAVVKSGFSGEPTCSTCSTQMRSVAA